MRYIKALIFLIFFYLFTFFYSVACIFTLFLNREQARQVYRLWAGIILKMLKIIVGIDYRYQIISEDGTIAEQATDECAGVVIASKHQSVFETIAYYYIYKNACFVLKKELLRIPLVGSFFIKAGMIPVNRKGGKSALMDMRDKAEIALKNNQTIILYPQGTRVRQAKEMDGNITRYKTGISALYEIDLKSGGKAGASHPIYPVAINSGYFWPKWGLNFHAGTVMIKRLPAIPANLSRKDMMAELERRIEKESLALWPEKEEK